MKINKQALSAYLQLRFVPGNIEIYPGKKAVKPPFNEKIPIIRKSNFSQTAKTLRNKLDLKIKNLCHGRVGVFLSGGLDSSLVVAMASKHTNLKTYGTYFEDMLVKSSTDFNKLLVDKFNLDHQNIEIKHEDIIKLIPEMVESMGQPIADPTYAVRYFLMKKLHKDLDVVLTGDAADELFGGYAQYNFMEQMKMVDMVPFKTKIIPFFAKNLFGLVNLVYPLAKATGPMMIERLRSALKEKDQSKRYLNVIGTFSDNELEELDLPAENSRFFESLNFCIYGLRQTMMTADYNLIIPDYYCIQWHMLKEKFGLSVESPFLDDTIVDMAFRMPVSFKKNKIILRKVADVLPKEIRFRRKQPWQTPVNRWIEEMNIQKEDLPSFKKEYVDRFFDKYHKNPLYYARQIWSMYIWEKWIEVENERQIDNPEQKTKGSS